MTILHRFSFVPQGYKCLSTSRTDRQGGGIALLFKEGLNIKQDMKYNFNSMECTDYQIALPGKQVRLGLIYRPPEKSVLDFCTGICRIHGGEYKFQRRTSINR